MDKKKVIVIYHGNCADGFGSAWVLRKAFTEQAIYHEPYKNPSEINNFTIPGDFENAEFIPGVYQMPPPDVTDAIVYIVDFSYKHDVILEMIEKAHRITHIDHHISAIKDLEYIQNPKYITYFDTEHSGVMLCWFYFFGGKEPPELVKIIEYRDLWKFKNPPTDYDNYVRTVQATIFSYPYDFDVWDMLMASDESDTHEMSLEGTGIERKHFKDIKELLKVGQRRAIIAGFDVPVANLPYTLSSDAGHIMGEGEPFAACYMDTPEGRIFSLRSAQATGIDVSVIAKKYGGGGHKNAAGFKLPHDQLALIPFAGSIK